MRTDWGGEVYTGPIWPSHFTAEQVKEAQSHYRFIPEKFYTNTKQLVVTPQNFWTWFEHHKDLGFRWHFQEQMSGSGLLSLLAYTTGLSTLFPVPL